MKINKILWLALTFSLVLASCKTTQINVTKPQVRTYSIQSVLWQQNAAEYRALCYQAFNLAKWRLDHYMEKNENSALPLAIITDVDETVLDNSPFNAKLILDNAEYTEKEWNNWVGKKAALAIPGATEFLNYAASKGVEVFYVSNRDASVVVPTISNMIEVGFPFADEKHLFFKRETGAKEQRFERVKETHHVLLYMGDNLSDFSNEFRTPSTEFRNSLADKMHFEFGDRFIVLPNPMYGDWESKGLYEGKHDWTMPQKDSIWKANLKGY